MRLPIGYSDFRKIIEKKLDYVDKTLFIRDIIDDTSEVILFTRPRRFGKTINLSMLHYFFADKVHGQSTEALFNNLNIAQSGKQYLDHQAQYPVIFLTFKDVKDRNFEAVYASFCKLLSGVYLEHEELLLSSKIADQQKVIYKSILEERASKIHVKTAIKDLTHYLYRHYNQKVIILIDEYDTPIQSGYLHGYYEEITEFMRSLLSTGLKDNAYLEKAILTGILRISKESLFSGLNNLKVYSLLNSRYGEYFGFTENEVKQLLVKAKLENLQDKIKDWYNGYQAGDVVVYNPWSIVNCLQEQGMLMPYWVNTSDNALIKNILIQSSFEFKKQFEQLLRKKSIEKIIDENFIFSDLQKNEAAAWSLLLMAGYLKIISYQLTARGFLCQLEIPNHEIYNLYRLIIERWLSNDYGIQWYDQFLKHLLDGNTKEFARDLEHILQQVVSFHDLTSYPEAFYHGLMLGFTASLDKTHYEVKSNRESGYGRFDIAIIPKNTSQLGILMELKAADKKDIEKTAAEALTQIREQNYTAEFTQRGIDDILKMGIAFKGKHLCIASER